MAASSPGGFSLGHATRRRKIANSSTTVTTRADELRARLSEQRERMAGDESATAYELTGALTQAALHRPAGCVEHRQRHVRAQLGGQNPVFGHRGCEAPHVLEGLRSPVEEQCAVVVEHVAGRGEELRPCT